MSNPDWHQVLRRNSGFQAMTAILDEAGIEWSVENGGKHFKLVFAVGGKAHKHIVSSTDALHVGAKKCACDIRRILRTAGIGADPQSQEPDMDSNSAVPSTDIIIPEIGIVEREGEPLARDVDIGERLGLKRPRVIRELIERNRGELEGFGSLAVQHGKSRGQDFSEYLLNEEQALLVSTLSSAPNAPAVRAMLIRTFVAWRRGHLQPAQPASGGDVDALLELMQEGFYGLRTAIEQASAKGDLTEDQMRALLRQHCEWEDTRFAKVIRAAFASGQNVVTALSGKRLPQISADDELDIDAVYRACGLAEHIPARRKLSGLVRNRLDAYCQDRRIPTGAVISLGQRVRTWPRQAVLAWFAEKGRDFIAAHIRAHTVDGQHVIAFPNSGEAR